MGVNKLVMVKNKRTYTYGNVAYNIEVDNKNKEKIMQAPKANNKKKTKAKFKIMAYISVLFMLSFLSLCRFATIIRITNNIHKIKNEIKQVQKANEDLMVSMAKYNNIKYIESTAVAKYGMVVPSNESVVYLDVKPLTALAEKEVKTEKLSFVKRLLGLIY